MSGKIAHQRAECIQNALKRLLGEQLPSINKLERCTGLNKGSISKILNGQTIRPGPETVQKLAQGLGIEPGKLNDILVHSANCANLKPTPDPNPTPQNHHDWGEAPDVSIFYGRTQELETLQQWIVNDNCRLVALLGIGGIGKTSLGVKLAQHIQHHFEYVIWRSLRYPPPVQTFLTHLLQFLYSPSPDDFPEDFHSRVSLLFQFLKTHRCLLLLDNTEAIFQSGQLAGRYHQDYQGYGEILRRIGESYHQSSVVIISPEKPEDINCFAGNNLPIRTLTLKGLSLAEAQYIFKAKDLSDSHQWSKLVERYQGNPLNLKIAATTIQDLFQGRVSDFLNRQTFVFGQIQTLLEKQFQRLSPLEQDALYWLAIEPQFVSLSQLQHDFWQPITTHHLFEIIDSLGRRSLIETVIKEEEPLFTLPLVVKEYVANRFINQICTEIRGLIITRNLEKIHFIINYAITPSNSSEVNPPKLQYFSLIETIKTQLISPAMPAPKIAEKLDELVWHLAEKFPLDIGYALDNLRYLAATFLD
ncbi:MAG: NB-ARC domain-containing protein [Coleofasciculus sp.]